MSAGEGSAAAVVLRNPLMGFGKVTTRVSIALAAAFVLVTAFPGLLRATALVPANTMSAHFFIWNVLTATFVESNIFGVITACGVTLLVGKQLEPLWGSKELLRFILVVALAGGATTFLLCLFLYAGSAGYLYEKFMNTPIHGHSGLTGAYLIAVKQLLPEQQNQLCGAIKVKSKDLAPLYVLAYTIFFLLGAVNHGTFSLVLFSTFGGWLYLRFFQPRPGGVVGDQHNEDFAFVEFFPKHPLVRRGVTFASTGCFRVAESCPCCKTMHVQKRNAAKVMQHAALPGHTQGEAERYRQRALDMLDQKLGSTGGTPSKAAPQANGSLDIEAGGETAASAP